MSVIRSTSSPEGLYIWQSSDEGGLRAEISWAYKGPLAKGRSMSVPWNDFRTVILGWHQHPPEPGDERCSNGFSAVERSVFLDTGKEAAGFSLKQLLNINQPSGSLIKIADDQGNHVHLWGVTWAFVMQSTIENYEDDEPEQEPKPSVRPLPSDLPTGMSSQDTPTGMLYEFRYSRVFEEPDYQFTLGNGACVIIGENSRRVLRIQIKRDRPGLAQIEELLDMVYDATEARGPRLAYMHIANRFGAALSFKPSVQVPG